MNPLKPPKLKKGDTIGIVATSFPFPTSETSEYFNQYRKGVETIESMGFEVREGKNLRKVKWWFAGTAKERAEDINSMFANPKIKAIIVHDGGQSAIAVLEHINYKLVKTNPKPFIGFSDITNIHSALFTQTGLVGFHAALLTYGLGKMWQKYPQEQIKEGKRMLFKVLTSTNPVGVIKPLSQWGCWRKGKAAGKLFGGNLSMISSLVGTKYFPKTVDLKNNILFWEIDNTPSYRIEKGLYQLKYSGILDVISGMLIGKLPDIKRAAWESLEEPTPKEIIMDTLKNYKFPIMGNMDFGHKIVDLPVPIGLNAKMDSEKLYFEVLESAVK